MRCLTACVVIASASVAAAQIEVRHSPWITGGDSSVRVVTWFHSGQPVRMRVTNILGKYGSEEIIVTFDKGEPVSAYTFGECLEFICKPGFTQQRIRFAQGQVNVLEERRGRTVTAMLQAPYRRAAAAQAKVNSESVREFLLMPGVKRNQLRVNAEGLDFEALNGFEVVGISIPDRMKAQVKSLAGQTVEFRTNTRYRFDSGLIEELAWLNPVPK